MVSFKEWPQLAVLVTITKGSIFSLRGLKFNHCILHGLLNRDSSDIVLGRQSLEILICQPRFYQQNQICLPSRKHLPA